MPEEKQQAKPTGIGTTPRPEEATGQQSSSGDLQSRVEQLEAALANARAGMPLSLIPEHGAGEGTEIADSWSQYDQEQAKGL